MNSRDYLTSQQHCLLYIDTAVDRYTSGTIDAHPSCAHTNIGINSCDYLRNPQQESLCNPYKILMYLRTHVQRRPAVNLCCSRLGAAAQHRCDGQSLRLLVVLVDFGFRLRTRGSTAGIAEGTHTHAGCWGRGGGGGPCKMERWSVASPWFSHARIRPLAPPGSSVASRSTYGSAAEITYGSTHAGQMVWGVVIYSSPAPVSTSTSINRWKLC